MDDGACPDDFENTERHIFHIMTKEDDTGIASCKCAILPRYETKHDKYYIKGDGKMEKGGTEAVDDDSYFVAEDVGNGEIAIRNLKENKYLKKTNRLIEAKTDSDCGDPCHFNLVDFSISTKSSTSGYSIYVLSLIHI